MTAGACGRECAARVSLAVNVQQVKRVWQVLEWHVQWSWVLSPHSSVLLHAIKWAVFLLFLLLSIVQGRLLQLSRNRFRHNSIPPPLSSLSFSLHMHANSACFTVHSINHAPYIVCLSFFLFQLDKFANNLLIYLAFFSHSATFHCFVLN